MQTDKATTGAITAKVWTIINGLPQRQAIVESDARFWVEEIVAQYGELAIWHATRAGGFGGSQIGAIVRNHLGQRADHEQSAHDIVEGALLRRLPDEPNGHMRRGIAMESQHRQWFYEKHSAKRDVAGFETLSASVGPRAWMRYSPDDLVFMTVPNASEVGRYLIDFKAPSHVDADEAVSFQYVCQLAMGEMVCQHNGLDLQGRMLSQFDWANWGLKDDWIESSDELREAITEAGDFYWAFVLRGHVPPFVRKPRLDIQDDLRANLNEKAFRLARLKALKGVIEKAAEGIEAELKPEIQKYHLGSSKLVLDGISFAATPKVDEEIVRNKLPEAVFAALPLKGNATKRYDESRLLATVKAQGLEAKDFLLPVNLDPQAVYEALLDNGFDGDAFVAEQLRSSVDKKLVTQMQSWAEQNLSHLMLKPEAPEMASVEGVGEGASNDREGQDAPRYVPSSRSA